MKTQKKGRRLILADGTALEDSQAGFADGMLWCWCKEMSMVEAARIFADKEKTETIVFEYGEMMDTYEGYTQCVSITIRQDETAICLARE